MHYHPDIKTAKPRKAVKIIPVIPLPIKAENWWQNRLEIPVYPTSFYLTLWVSV
jgi:hypothetical protein